MPLRSTLLLALVACPMASYADDVPTDSAPMADSHVEPVTDPSLAPLAPSEVFQQQDYAPRIRSTYGCDGGCELGGHGRRGLADKHAPAGLMGDHVHDRGEWMVEYKYSRMSMDVNRIGHRRVSDASTIVPGFTVDGVRTNGGASPTQMDMEMHMVHLMYGLTDDVTLYTMLMFPSLTMDHVRGPGNPAGRGTPFTTHNSGIGDTTIGALVKLWDSCDEDLILNVGGSLPTGEIRTTTTVPTGGRVTQVLPYPMRRGSGTFNAIAGLTYKKYFESGSFGTQFVSNVPIGRNYRGYSVGDTYRYNVWYSHLACDNVAFSLRLENLWRTNFDGADPQTANQVISTNVEQFRGGYWLNLGIGSSVLVKGHLFSVEYVPTLYQDVSGIQLGTDWAAIASWSKAF